MKSLLSLSLLMLCAAAMASAQELRKIGDFVMSTPDGKILPPESAANIADLATISAKAVANAQAAALSSQALAHVEARQSEIEALIYAQEGTLYLDAFNCLTVGPPVAIDTNLIASIIFFEPKIRPHTDPNWLVNRVTMTFSEDPGYLPIFRATSNLRTTNIWDQATIIDQGYTNRLIGATYYQNAVFSDVLTPAAWSNAFLRASVRVRGSGTNVVNFTINNGISVRGTTPLTATFLSGTNVLKIVGGIICQP